MHAVFFVQAVTTARPVRQPTPVTRTWPAPGAAPLQVRAAAPGGALGVVALAVGSPPPVWLESPEEPQPAIATAQTAAARKSRAGQGIPPI